MARSGSRVHSNKAGRRKPKSRGEQRTVRDETTGGGGGGRGGRPRGTAARSRTRTTSESTGEVDAVPGRPKPVSGSGKGSKTDAPRSTRTTSGGRSSGARKGRNRPGASGTGRKKK